LHDALPIYEFHQKEEIDRIIPEIAELASMAATCTVASHPVRKHLLCVNDFITRLHRSDGIRPRDYYEPESLLIQLARCLRKYHNQGRKKFSSQYSRDEILAAKQRLERTLSEF